MSTGYETFVRDPAQLREGRRVLLVLRDLTPGRRKYFARHVVGIVSRTPDADGGAVPLTVRSAAGNRFPGAWYVRVVEQLPSRVPGAPYEDAGAAMQAAWGDAADASPG